MERAALIDWGVATLMLAGERESGDLHLVKPVGTGVLVSVVDGLGHGAEAAAAARARGPAGWWRLWPCSIARTTR